MDNEGDEINYALKIIDELRNKRFQFHQEIDRNSKRYIFTVRNNEGEDGSQSEEDMFSRPEQQPKLEAPDRSNPTVEEAPEPAARFVPKNLIKNFVCAFSNYMHSSQREAEMLELLMNEFDPERILDKVRAHLKGLLKAKKFNTQMLQHLLSMQEYRRLFRLFLSKAAVEWIERGRMGEKTIYLDTVRYLTEYVNGDLKTRLKFSYHR